jgi:adenylate kinase family enzyme
VINTTSALRPYRTTQFDTLKIYTKAHGFKTMNLVINFEHDDEWIMSDLSRTLVSYGVENETEISVFNREAYEEFKKNPEEKW